MDKKQLEKIAESKTIPAKLTLKELVGGVEALTVLSSLKLPVFVSFQLSMFLKNTTPFLEIFDEQKLKLAKEMGTQIKDKNGKETGNYNLDKEQAEKFNEKIKPLLEAELDIKIPEIPLLSLGDINIEPKYLLALTWLFPDKK